MSVKDDIKAILEKPDATRAERTELIRKARAEFGPDRKNPEKFDEKKLEEFDDALEELMGLPSKPPGGADPCAEALALAKQALATAEKALEVAKQAAKK